VVDLGLDEWLIIIAVILLALKFGYQEIRRRFFGKTGTDDTGNDENDIHMGDKDRSRASDHEDDTMLPSSLHGSQSTGSKSETGQAPIHITNIEIHDSIISRSTILPEDEDPGADVNTEIEDSVVLRSKISKRTDDP